MGKEKIYDEVFYRINLVLGGRLTPEEFTEELSAKIRDLEEQVKSLSGIMAGQEYRINELEERNNKLIKMSHGIQSDYYDLWPR